MAYSTINPSTGEHLLTFDTLSDAELDQRLERAHRPMQQTGAGVQFRSGR